MEFEFPEGQGTFERPERLADLLTLSRVPMLAWSLDGPISFWNAGAEDLYGFSRDQAVGKVSHALLKTRIPRRFGCAAFSAHH